MKKEKIFRTKILNPNSNNKDMYLYEIKEYLNKLDNIDIIAVSTGFDLGKEDWGGLLFPKDYNKIGKLLKKFSNKLSNGRRFAVLEGGYNLEVLRVNFNSFCQGFK